MVETRNRLYVDAGNTMVKLLPSLADAVPDWQNLLPAVRSVPGDQWASLDQAIEHLQDIAPAMQHPGAYPVVHMCSVRGPAFEQVIREACTQLGWSLQVMQVQNNTLLQTQYKQATQLGKDRWAACLAVAAATSSKANLVVSFGTATTLDAVVHASLLSQGRESFSAKWVHLGGFIVPGVDTMLNSLAHATAQLPKAALDWVDWPNTTEQAIGAGVARQQISMVRDVMQALRSETGQTAPTLWCTGGHAVRLLPALLTLGCPVESFEHAVLRGLWLGQQLDPGVEQ
ncbi:MAG TPA: type III pantothenate kinase [Limnobacter sp.]|nr:type III pantothenate kinase [Limnobacter sp.]